MHHGILVKTNGRTVEDARKQVEEIMEETMACRKCNASKHNVNWDYFTIHAVVDNKWVKETKNYEGQTINTPEELAVFYREVLLKDEKKRIEQRIKEGYAKLFDEKGNIIRFNSLGYYLDELEKICNIEEFGDADEGLYTLHCIGNHYADVTEFTNGDNVFYFWVDRHY